MNPHTLGSTSHPLFSLWYTVTEYGEGKPRRWCFRVALPSLLWLQTSPVGTLLLQLRGGGVILQWPAIWLTFMALLRISEWHTGRFHNLTVLLFLNHNGSDRACHPAPCRHTHTQLGTSANGKGVSGAQPLGHILTYTLQNCNLLKMHYVPRLSIKADCAVETKELKGYSEILHWIHTVTTHSLDSTPGFLIAGSWRHVQHLNSSGIWLLFRVLDKKPIWQKQWGKELKSATSSLIQMVWFWVEDAVNLQDRPN